MPKRTLIACLVALCVIIVLIIPLTRNWIASGLNQFLGDHAALGLPAQSQQTVTLGNQVWSSKNQTAKPIVGQSWCADNDPQCKNTRYYDWLGAVSICSSTAWHLPTSDDWQTMLKFVSSTWGANKIEDSLRMGGASGFGDIHAGMRAADTGKIVHPEESLYWSFNQPTDSSSSYGRSSEKWFFDATFAKNAGLSVRCVKNLIGTSAVATAPVFNHSATSLHQTHSNDLIAWKEGPFTYTLITANLIDTLLNNRHMSTIDARVMIRNDDTQDAPLLQSISLGSTTNKAMFRHLRRSPLWAAVNL